MINVGFAKKDLESRVSEEEQNSVFKKRLFIGGVSAAVLLVVIIVFFVIATSSAPTDLTPVSKHSSVALKHSVSKVLSLQSKTSVPFYVSLVRTKWPMLLAITVSVLVAVGVTLGVVLTRSGHVAAEENSIPFAGESGAEEETMSTTTKVLLAVIPIALVLLSVGGYFVKIKYFKTVEPIPAPVDDRIVQANTNPRDLFPHWDRRVSETEQSLNRRRLASIALWAKRLMTKHGDSLREKYPGLVKMTQKDPLFPIQKDVIISPILVNDSNLFYAGFYGFRDGHYVNQLDNIQRLAEEVIKVIAEKEMRFSDFAALKKACEDILMRDWTIENGFNARSYIDSKLPFAEA